MIFPYTYTMLAIAAAAAAADVSNGIVGYFVLLFVAAAAAAVVVVSTRRCRTLSAGVAANKTVKENYNVRGTTRRSMRMQRNVRSEFIAILACGNFVISHFVLIWS